ncbi:MAG: hypothetical protein HKN47_24065 [Pirellulaceae bacterium]|nr:hypothetical protein [Pirellulaceae bacterium]
MSTLDGSTSVATLFALERLPHQQKTRNENTIHTKPELRVLLKVDDHLFGLRGR